MELASIAMSPAGAPRRSLIWSLQRPLALIAISALALPLAARAALADAVSATCANPSAAGTNAQQAQQYCQAAESADKAASADGIVWKVYAAVAAVCTTECVGSLMSAGFAQAGGTVSYVCTGGSAAAGVFDGIETQNYMSAVQSIAGAGMGILINHMMSDTDAKGADGSDKSTYKTDYGSCLQAANAVVETMMTKNNADNETQSMNQNLAQAQQLISSATPASAGVISVPTSGSFIGGGGLVNAPAIAGTTNPVNLQAVMRHTTTAASCNTAAQTANTGAAIQCAATAAPNLGSILNNPNFPNAFQQASGTSLGNFVQTPMQSPAQAVTGGMSGALKSDALGKLASAIDQMQQKYMPQIGGEESVYAGGGGGAKSGGDVAAGFAGFMSQFMPKKNAAQKAFPETTLAGFGTTTQRRLASAAPEDRTVSLFDRVAGCYASLAPLLLTPNPTVQTLRQW